jgi:acyl carrier protein
MPLAPSGALDLPPGADLYRDIGVKSVAALELLLSLEDAFGVSIDDEAFGEARSIETLVKLIHALLADA